jgi:competence protein ComEA
MFNLTTQECKVILFFTIVALAGIAIDLSRKNNGLPPQSIQIRKDFSQKDLNKSTVPDLVYAHAASENLAAKIIAYRDIHGEFRSMEDVRKVKGVGPARLEKLKEGFYVE